VNKNILPAEINKNPFSFMRQICCQIQSDKIYVILKEDLPKKKKDGADNNKKHLYVEGRHKIPGKKLALKYDNYATFSSLAGGWSSQDIRAFEQLNGCEKAAPVSQE